MEARNPNEVAGFLFFGARPALPMPRSARSFARANNALVQLASVLAVSIALPATRGLGTDAPVAAPSALTLGCGDRVSTLAAMRVPSFNFRGCGRLKRA